MIRGVKCDHAVNKLIEYNLVCEVGRMDAPGRPILFGTTEEFLRSFGIASLEDLPAVNPEQVEDFKHEAEEEVVIGCLYATMESVSSRTSVSTCFFGTCAILTRYSPEQVEDFKHEAEEEAQQTLEIVP